jgi:hypothetical protein
LAPCGQAQGQQGGLRRAPRGLDPHINPRGLQQGLRHRPVPKAGKLALGQTQEGEGIGAHGAGAEDGDKAGGASPKDKDELYDAAVEVVIREGRGSVSLLQRALGVGYGRGARLIDFMAEDGVVGQYAGSQAREVLITMEQWAARSGTAPLPPDPAPRKLKIQPHAELLPAPSAPPHDEAVTA